MKFLTKLRNFWSKGQHEGEDPYSIVLLLREPHFFTSDEIEVAGKRGFGISFDGNEDPMYFVSQSGKITFIKAGKHVVHVIHAKTPYLDEPKVEVANQLPQPEQKEAWLAHSAWAALDLINLRKEISKSDAYSTLAKFALHLGDSNCTGIYLPSEQVMMPNDGTAEEGLRFLIRKELFRN